MKSAIDIWRTYYNARRNISESGRMIDNYLFQREKSVSQYTKKDADLLTQFFRDLKSYQSSNNPGTKIKGVLLGYEVESLPVLDFLKGGQSQGGIEFEKEIEKLFDYSSEEALEDPSLIKGQSTATAYINLGTDDKDKAYQFVTEYINEEVEAYVQNFEKKLVLGGDIGAAPPNSLYLKIGAKRFGKIDVQAGTGAQIDIQISGEPKGQLARAFDILRNASFSIKSYKTAGDIHLGNTGKAKAVSAVAEYVAVKTKSDLPRWAGIFFLHHQDQNKGKPEEANARAELYPIYDRMKKVYELTGIGLRYNDLDDLKGVDFLLVNRAFEGGDIKVYSAQALLQDLYEKGKFDID